MGVEKGDVIKVEPENKWILQKVEWRSKLKHNEDEYYCANFENTKSRQGSQTLSIPTDNNSRCD